MTQYHSESGLQLDMEKIISVISYLSIVGWMLAIVLYGKNRSALACFHLRQALGLIITTALLSFIPLIGWLLTIVVAVIWLIALYNVIIGEKFFVPLLGQYYQESLDFIR